MTIRIHDDSQGNVRTIRQQIAQLPAPIKTPIAIKIYSPPQPDQPQLPKITNQSETSRKSFIIPDMRVRLSIFAVVVLAWLMTLLPG